MAEYEALILGLQLVRKLGAKRVSIMGDSELIIKQINGEYSVNNP
jgi:ribonuclease HI